MRALLIALVSLVPALFVADIPEFMQQYRQRIGGAIGELRRVLRDFDQDAWRSGLNRDSALSLMSSNPEPFFRDRATRIVGYSARLARLEQQEQVLAQGASLFTAIAFYRNYDEEIYNETLKAYRWGVNADSVQFALVAWLLSVFTLGIPTLLVGSRSRSHA